MKQADIMAALGLPVITTGRKLAWRDHAACTPYNPEMFHPDGKVGDEYKTAVGKAKAVCARCPVATECLAYGMTQKLGVFGGKTSGERDSMRKRSRNRVRIVNITMEDR